MPYYDCCCLFIAVIYISFLFASINDLWPYFWLSFVFHLLNPSERERTWVTPAQHSTGVSYGEQDGLLSRSKHAILYGSQPWPPCCVIVVSVAPSSGFSIFRPLLFLLSRCHRYRANCWAGRPAESYIRRHTRDGQQGRRYRLIDCKQIKYVRESDQLICEAKLRHPSSAGAILNRAEVQVHTIGWKGRTTRPGRHCTGFFASAHGNAHIYNKISQQQGKIQWRGGQLSSRAPFSICGRTEGDGREENCPSWRKWTRTGILTWIRGMTSRKLLKPVEEVMWKRTGGAGERKKKLFVGPSVYF